MATNIIVDNSLAEVRPVPYKVYIAILNQSGTNAPTARVLENTLGQVPTFEYFTVGTYYILFSPDVNISNVYVMYPNPVSGSTAFTHFSVSVDGASQFSLYTQGDNGTGYNDSIVEQPLEIRLYP